MANGSGDSRGDRNRNAVPAVPAGLRASVPPANAIVAIDLADAKQMVVVCDHDSKVLARKTFRCRARNLGVAMDWLRSAPPAAASAGLPSPASRPITAGEYSLSWPRTGRCRSSACSSWQRRTEALTVDKTDEKDAVLIARLTARLPCYLPEPVDQTWSRLRHPGARLSS